MVRLLGILLFCLWVSPLCLASEETACEPVDFQKPRRDSVTEYGCFYSGATATPVRYSVTFPPRYEARKEFPFVIFLHGRGGNERQFAAFGGTGALDDFVSRGGTPFLVIAPAEPRHSYWKDGPRGEFGTRKMLARDLLGHLQAHAPHLNTKSSGRAVMGISMGGHGASFLACSEPGLFGQAYLISPIYRREAELEEVDKASFGQGEDFLRQDPVNLHRKSGDCLPGRLAAEIGRDDTLLKRYDGTREFLLELRDRYGDEAVNLSRRGGHDAQYWKGALHRAMEFLGTGFPGPKEVYDVPGTSGTAATDSAE